MAALNRGWLTILSALKIPVTRQDSNRYNLFLVISVCSTSSTVLKFPTDTRFLSFLLSDSFSKAPQYAQEDYYKENN